VFYNFEQKEKWKPVSPDRNDIPDASGFNGWQEKGF
jgi:hypothetical protein